MNIDKDALRKKAEVATQGNWHTDDPWIVYSDLGGEVIYLADTSGLDTTRTQYPKDAAYIAAANPITVIALLDENAALVVALKQARNTLAELDGVDTGMEPLCVFEEIKTIDAALAAVGVSDGSMG